MSPINPMIARGMAGDPFESEKLKRMQEQADEEKNKSAREKEALERQLSRMKKELAMANSNNSRLRKDKKGRVQKKKTFDPTSHRRADPPTTETKAATPP